MTDLKKTRAEAKACGDNKYFTALPCKHGHMSPRSTVNGGCNACQKILAAENHKKRYEKNKEAIKEKVRQYKLENYEKVLESKRTSYYANKDEILAKQAKYKAENPEIFKERSKAAWAAMTPEKRQSQRERLRVHAAKMYKENPGKHRAMSMAFHWKNRESRLSYNKAWKEANSQYVIEYRQRPEFKQKGRFFTSRRRAFKLRATPSWANLDAIEQIYATLPQGWHVDHIVPLVSKLVCGLHCEANLRHLPRLENQSKGNRHWPDMP